MKVTNRQIEKAARALAKAHHKNPDELVPPARGKFELVPMWKKYETIAKIVLEDVELPFPDFYWEPGYEETSLDRAESLVEGYAPGQITLICRAARLSDVFALNVTAREIKIFDSCADAQKALKELHAAAKEMELEY